MNIRIKFQKYGAMKFISHLDVMRYFQKAIRRAKIDICFSEGFSPHMIMSFASPLSLGVTSEAEYMDIRVKEASSSDQIKASLNQTMAEGIDVLSVRLLPENSKNAMSLVAAADYEIRFREDAKPEAGWEAKFLEFLKSPEIRLLKKTKKGEQEVDIRPWIYQCAAADGVIMLQAAAGSVHNLKPELLIQAFADWAGIALEPFSLLVHRKELYADTGDGEKKVLIPLEELGEEFGE